MSKRFIPKRAREYFRFMAVQLEMFQTILANKFRQKIYERDDFLTNLNRITMLLNRFLTFEENELYVANNINLFIMTTDVFLYFSLFYKTCLYDAQKYLIATDSRSLNWGNDYFKYFMEKSQKIEK